jgi:hypothetical protein
VTATTRLEDASASSSLLTASSALLCGGLAAVGERGRRRGVGVGGARGRWDG